MKRYFTLDHGATGSSVIPATKGSSFLITRIKIQTQQVAGDTTSQFYVTVQDSDGNKIGNTPLKFMVYSLPSTAAVYSEDWKGLNIITKSNTSVIITYDGGGVTGSYVMIEAEEIPGITNRWV